MPKSKRKSKQKNKQKNGKPKLTLKERLAQQRKQKQARQKFISTVSICLAIAVIIGLPLGFATNLKIGIALGAGIPAMVASFLYPRQALWFFLIYLPISGTVTYWIGGGNALFQLAKDAFYIPALIGLILGCRKEKSPILIPKQILPTLAILLILALCTLLIVNGALEFNPKQRGYPFFQGILGLKVLIGYFPLVFCGYQLIKTKKELLFCTRLHLVLAIICCLLGFVQYYMLLSGRCAGTGHLSGDELFKATLSAKCFVGGSLVYSPAQGAIRLPGTFVSPWHWAWFLIPNSALTFAVAFGDPKVRWRIIGLVGMALVFANAVICGQRIALALVPLVAVVLIVLTGQIGDIKRFFPIMAGLVLILGIAIANNPELIQERIDGFKGRWEASPPTAFIEGQFGWAFKQKPGLIGKGLGRATNSTRIFGRTKLVETYHPKLIYETGYLGVLAFIAVCSHLMIICFKSYRSVKEKNLRNLGSSFWVFLMIISYFPYWYPLDTDPVAVYYWFFAGMILRLPFIDQQEQERLRLEEENNPDIRKKKRSKKKKRRVVSSV